jgi:hypothetical protein
MALTVDVKKDFPLKEVSNVIRSALALDERIAKYKKAKYASICKNFETKYGMSSDIFMKKFDSGELDDRDDFFDWYAAKKGLDTWNKKLEILSEISL